LEAVGIASLSPLEEDGIASLSPLEGDGIASLSPWRGTVLPVFPLGGGRYLWMETAYATGVQNHGTASA
jgi:hypothetical protein